MMIKQILATVMIVCLALAGNITAEAKCRRTTTVSGK